MYLNKNIQAGAIGELAAQKYFVERNYEIFIPLDGHSEFDFIIYCQPEMLRVSVKTATKRKNKSYRVDLRQNRYNGKQSFDCNSCDLLAVYILPEDRIEVFEAAKITQRTSMNVS
jgi:hypothetical protein